MCTQKNLPTAESVGQSSQEQMYDFYLVLKVSDFRQKKLKNELITLFSKWDTLIYMFLESANNTWFFKSILVETLRTFLKGPILFFDCCCQLVFSVVFDLNLRSDITPKATLGPDTCKADYWSDFQQTTIKKKSKVKI